MKRSFHKRTQPSLTPLALAIFRANGALITRGDALVASLGLTSARWQVLGALALSSEALTVPGIARSMGLTRQAIQKQVDLLKAAGLVVLRDNPEHERSPLVELTAKGRTAFQQADERWAEEAQRLVAGVSKPTLTSSVHLLDQLTQRLLNSGAESDDDR